MQRNREAAPEAERTKTSQTSEDRQNQGTIPMPTFATRPLTTSSTIPVELLQNHMVEQQRQQISELHFDKFPNPQSLLVWNLDSKHKSLHVLNFYRMLCCGSKKWRRLTHQKNCEILAISLWTGFSKLRDAGREDRFCSEQDHPEFPVQEDGQSRGTECTKRRSVSTRRQIAFMIHDNFRVTSRPLMIPYCLCYSS